jgi:hypothetical protein
MKAQCCSVADNHAFEGLDWVPSKVGAVTVRPFVSSRSERRAGIANPDIRKVAAVLIR